jgi:hypothetical protein
VVTLVTGSALLLVLAVVLGTGWARTNADLADERRAHAAARDLLRAELDAVTARRTQLERDLAAAQAQALGPQGRTAIEACVREYAEYERVLADLVSNGSWRAITSGATSALIIARYNQDFTPHVSTACRDAEPHLSR